jgi:hypothetical protein
MNIMLKCNAKKLTYPTRQPECDRDLRLGVSIFLLLATQCRAHRHCSLMFSSVQINSGKLVTAGAFKGLDVRIVISQALFLLISIS